MGTQSTWGTEAGERIFDFTVPEESPGDYSFSACDSSYDTVLSLYSADLGTLIASNDDFCGTQSQLDVDISPGLYKLVVEGYASSEGSFSVTARCPVSTNPTATPTASPSVPSTTKSPTMALTVSPSVSPTTGSPTMAPTVSPSVSPTTGSPTMAPTVDTSLFASLLSYLQNESEGMTREEQKEIGFLFVEFWKSAIQPSSTMIDQTQFQ